jgi:hypothetical protein
MNYSFDILASNEQKYYETCIKLGSFCIRYLRNVTTPDYLNYSKDY